MHNVCLQWSCHYVNSLRLLSRNSGFLCYVCFNVYLLFGLTCSCLILWLFDFDFLCMYGTHGTVNMKKNYMFIIFFYSHSFYLEGKPTCVKIQIITPLKSFNLIVLSCMSWLEKNIK